MQRKLSELDGSYWDCSGQEIEKNHKLFLDRHREPAEYEVWGLKFICPPNIYHPGEFGSTRFSLRGLFSDLSRWGNEVLEIGAGCGAIGLSLAKTGRNVTMVDIDHVAVECARNNAELNKIAAKIYQSDLFAAVNGRKYDLIMFNIPLMDKVIEEPLEIIACDKDGELFKRFMNEAKSYLLPNGYVCVNISNIGNRNAILDGLSSYDDSIVYAEYYAGSNEWRWLLAAQPLG